MHKRIVVGCMASAVAVALGAVWLLTRPNPAPVPPIDYKAELTKLALKGQPGDPSAENGWPELVEVATAVHEIGSTISNRESDADQTLSLTGREAEVEPWSWDSFGGWGCEARTGRDERITAEVWQRVADERILERLGAALGHDVFIMDFDGRLGAQMRTNWGNVQRSEVPSRLRTLSRMLTGLTERAMDAGNWEEALARMQDHARVARAATLQPDTMMWLMGGAMRWSLQATLERSVLKETVPPRAFLVRAREILDSVPAGSMDTVIDVLRLEAKEMIDVSADMMRQGGVTARIMTTLQGWTPETVARANVDEWGELIRQIAIDNVDPRLLSANVAAIHAEVEQAKGINALGLQSMSSAANLVANEASLRRNAEAFDIVLALALSTSVHGAPPETLDALVPECLPELPKDPWAPDGKYRYIPGPTMKDIVLYTVGWDGVDDGGHYLPARPDRGLTPEGKGLDYVFTRDACKDRAENPEAWEQP